MSETVSNIPGDKTIYLPIAESIDYEKLVKDRKAFRQSLDQLMDEYPELFPVEIALGLLMEDEICKAFVDSHFRDVGFNRLKSLPDKGFRQPFCF